MRMVSFRRHSELHIYSSNLNFWAKLVAYITLYYFKLNSSGDWFIDKRLAGLYSKARSSIDEATPPATTTA
jgi:hypothetical protein